MKVLVFGTRLLAGQFVEGNYLEEAEQYGDYKVLSVTPATEHGFELSNWEIRPRAWWITLEVADPDELKAWNDGSDVNTEQHASMWAEVKKAL